MKKEYVQVDIPGCKYCGSKMCPCFNQERKHKYVGDGKWVLRDTVNCKYCGSAICPYFDLEEHHIMTENGVWRIK